MANRCEACLVTCIDYRLHQRKDGRNYVAEFLQNLKVDCDLITRGGGVLDLIRPAKVDYDDSVLKDANIAAKFHNARIVYLLAHEDCGAYNKMGFFSREEELGQHYTDLNAARSIILNEFPHLEEVKLYFAELQPGTEDIFIIKEVVIEIDFSLPIGLMAQV